VTSLLVEAPAEADYSATIRRVAEALVTRSRETYLPPADVAWFFALAGDKDRCLEWLERASEIEDESDARKRPLATASEGSFSGLDGPLSRE
jgi:hypothetical protein